MIVYTKVVRKSFSLEKRVGSGLLLVWYRTPRRSLYQFAHLTSTDGTHHRLKLQVCEGDYTSVAVQFARDV